MKTFKLHVLAILTLFMASCSNDDDGVNLVEVESNTVTNLHAPQQGGQGQPISGAFTKFDFATGQTTTSETDWDIAFRGTTIAVNGGASTGTVDEPARNGQASAAIVTGTFASVAQAPAESEFLQDSTEGFAIPTGSDNGWYNYNFATNLITPIPGKVLVFKTRNGNFAKVEILSYYEDAPAQPDPNVDAGRYYTFNYVYNPNEGQNTFTNE